MHYVIHVLLKSELKSIRLTKECDLLNIAYCPIISMCTDENMIRLQKLFFFSSVLSASHKVYPTSTFIQFEEEYV